eukprot:3747076-Amphidinium_carterae.1
MLLGALAIAVSALVWFPSHIVIVVGFLAARPLLLSSAWMVSERVVGFNLCFYRWKMSPPHCMDLVSTFYGKLVNGNSAAP